MPLESLLFTRKPKLSLPPSTLEYEISIAASLAHYFIAQKRAVGLVAQDRTYTVITAERSERQENKILETLAFIEGKGELSIAALAGAHARLLPKGSTVILLTPTTSDDILLVADDLQRRGLRPVVVLLAAESFGGQPGTGPHREPLAGSTRSATAGRMWRRPRGDSLGPACTRPYTGHPQHGKDRHCHT